MQATAALYPTTFLTTRLFGILKVLSAYSLVVKCQKQFRYFLQRFFSSASTLARFDFQIGPCTRAVASVHSTAKRRSVKLVSCPWAHQCAPG